MSEVLNLNTRGEPGRFLPVRGTDYPLADRKSFGLLENSKLRELLVRMRDKDAAGANTADEKAQLTELATIALPTAPEELLGELEPWELREICSQFLSWAAGRGVMRILANEGLDPAPQAVSSLATLIAIVLRDTTPFKTIGEVAGFDGSAEDEDGESA
jgi:hypothetical protein